MAGDDTDPADFRQFVHAYEADYVTRDGRLVIDEPEVRAGLAKALDGYTALYRKGCAPPDAVGWDDYGNNKAFLEQRVVMTVNATLSIPGALRATRPEDYARERGHARVAERTPTASRSPSSPGRARPRSSGHGGHEAAATGVRALPGGRGLARALARLRRATATCRRCRRCSSSRSGSTRATRTGWPSAMQFLTRPHDYGYAAASGDWRHQLVEAEGVWPKAVHRVVVDGLTPEQAVDEAIARVKQLLSE